MLNHVLKLRVGRNLTMKLLQFLFMVKGSLSNATGTRSDDNTMRDFGLECLQNEIKVRVIITSND